MVKGNIDFNKQMKKLLILALLFTSCKKEENKAPVTIQTHTVQITGNSAFNSHVTIDGVDQGQVNHTFQVNNGQAFVFTDSGDDSFNPTTLTTIQGYINVTVYIDGTSYYTHSGYDNATLNYNP